MQFKDIIGHEEAKSALREMVDSGRIPHALLLSGVPGIGKMRLARAFIQYLNCENRSNGDSCGVCPSCRRIQKFSEPDIHYIYPFVKRKNQKINVSSDILELWIRMLEEYPYMPVREWLRLIEAGNSQPSIYVTDSDDIAETASLSAYASKYKVFVIWLPEKMQPAAANKLLKLIEEPFEDTIFIAVSNDSSSILPTIYSRMRRIDMKRPDNETVASALVSMGETKERAKEIARLSGGDLQKAFDLVTFKDENAEFGEAFRNAMRLAYACKIAELRTLADRFNDMGREKGVRLLDYFAAQIRENFIANLRMPVLNVMTGDEEAFSQKFAPFIHEGNVEDILTDIDDASRDIVRNANGKLIWFDFLLRLMTNIRKKRL